MPPANPAAIKSALKQHAARLGFEACGVSRAVRLDDEARRLDAWLLEGRHASMNWMTGHYEKRIDPRRLVHGARSVISVLHTYYQEEASPPSDPALGRISRYAVGEDYHIVVKDRLYELFECLREEAGPVEGRAFTDSAPVMDKAWAQRSGLGWIGKHTNLLRRESGSWFFIGELIVDLDLPPDDPATDYCGSCTRCLDACPTQAIYRPYAVDANRCISYTTIEHRGDDIPSDIAAGHDNWIFGCDICQEVCPWNKFRKETRESRYTVRPGTTTTPLDEWEELDLETFRERFRYSPVKRAKLDGFKRNVRIAQANRERPSTSGPDDRRPPPPPLSADGQ